VNALSPNFLRPMRIVCWSLLLVLCAWVYWPGLGGSSLLDDGYNLRVLEQLEDDSISFHAVVFSNSSGPLGRPVSMFSFALEKVYLDGGVRGSKLVNLTLHLLCATLLLFFSRDIYRRLGLPGPWIAGIAVASLWAFAPMMLSTVLYSVQRMALLSSLFVLLSLWSYLRWRISRGAVAWCWLGVTLLALVLAPLSKENGLLAMPLIIVLEWMVLRYEGWLPTATKWLKTVHGAIFFGGVLVLLLGTFFFHERVLSGYLVREFDLPQRLMTEARILWTYVWQLLWVNPDILGIYHDDQLISKSLVQPLSTLWAVAAWLVLILMVVFLKHYRIASVFCFGVAFFLVAHSMESTVISLELYFEHRNYLPAMGLYIALVGIALLLVSKWVWLGNWCLLYWLFFLDVAPWCSLPSHRSGRTST
jgi:hypothetical protein